MFHLNFSQLLAFTNIQIKNRITLMRVIVGKRPVTVYKTLPENVYHRGSIHLDSEIKIPVSCGGI
jgi:hypothetical protein